MRKSFILAGLLAGLLTGALSSAVPQANCLPAVSSMMSMESTIPGCPNEQCKSKSECEKKTHLACLISYVPAQRCDTEQCNSEPQEP